MKEWTNVFASDHTDLYHIQRKIKWCTQTQELESSNCQLFVGTAMTPETALILTWNTTWCRMLSLVRRAAHVAICLERAGSMPQSAPPTVTSTAHAHWVVRSTSCSISNTWITKKASFRRRMILQRSTPFGSAFVTPCCHDIFSRKRVATCLLKRRHRL